jgi:protein-disulfide isomerase
MVESSDTTRLLLPSEDHIQGPECAPYTLVEYGDYACPACARVSEIIGNLQAILGERLRIVYRHYPLSGVHPEAQEAAEAAEAAGRQGRFWEMHRVLFQNQNALKRKNLLSYGEALGLDIDRFRDELKRRMHRERVRQDFRRGVERGVYKPPGLFLNGERISHFGPCGAGFGKGPDIPELAWLQAWYASHVGLAGTKGTRDHRAWGLKAMPKAQ